MRRPKLKNAYVFVGARHDAPDAPKAHEVKEYASIRRGAS
jgi:hypothetical protein